MKEKIAIITHYYQSPNYGGNLQAFALCKVLQDLGYEAEQLSYSRHWDIPLWSVANPVRHKMSRIMRIAFRKFCLPIIQLPHFSVMRNLALRKKAILAFNQNRIPHSQTVFDYNTISRANDDYRVFITGSDQVWHPQAACGAYLLDFVAENNIKISYAASLAVNELEAQQQETYSKYLQDYLAISVRESNAIDLIQPISPVAVKWTLDPTLLLSREKWDEICTDRKIKNNYIFCYFLGDDSQQRELAEEYAAKHNLELVTLPHLLGVYRKCDKHFGNHQLYDVSPADFISLIRYADCIFTDSFHASAFSLIYQKEFFVFERNSYKSMGSRLLSLTSLFDMQARFCDTSEKMSLDYIESLPPIDYAKEFPKFEAMKESSICFLQTNLEKAEIILKQNENQST